MKYKKETKLDETLDGLKEKIHKEIHIISLIRKKPKTV